jgi:hypothetical protein
MDRKGDKRWAELSEDLVTNFLLKLLPPIERSFNASNWKLRSVGHID